MKLFRNITVIFLIIILAGCGSQIAYYKRGVYYEKKGNYVKALDSYRSSVKKDST